MKTFHSILFTVVAHHVLAVDASNTVEDLFFADRRLLLFNSRSASGECLTMCIDHNPSSTLTGSPTVEELVGTPNPTTFPTAITTGSSTEGNEPTGKPTQEPTLNPTKSPTRSLANTPTTNTRDDSEEEKCDCDVDNDSAQSWRCGRNIYSCPGVDQICNSQARAKSKYYLLTQDQCDRMKSISIGENCIPLPQYGVENGKELGSRVCYDNNGSHRMNFDKKGCNICKKTVSPIFETEI